MGSSPDGNFTRNIQDIYPWYELKVTKLKWQRYLPGANELNQRPYLSASLDVDVNQMEAILSQRLQESVVNDAQTSKVKVTQVATAAGDGMKHLNRNLWTKTGCLNSLRPSNTYMYMRQ